MDKPLTDADLQSIYESYRHWADDVGDDGVPDETWWAGHGYDSGKGEPDRWFEFDIMFGLGYETDDETDPTDFGVWLYYVYPPDYQIPLTGVDVTAQFKAYVEARDTESRGE